MCRLWNLWASKGEKKNESLSLRKALLFIKQIISINIYWFLIWASEDGWSILSMELSIEQGSVEGKTRMNAGIKTRRCILDGNLINKFNLNKELLLDLILTNELSHDPSCVIYVYMYVHSYIISKHALVWKTDCHSKLNSLSVSWQSKGDEKGTFFWSNLRMWPNLSLTSCLTFLLTFIPFYYKSQISNDLKPSARWRIRTSLKE